MTTLAELLAAVDAARDEVVALTAELVRVPSVNTGVMPTGDETPACNVLAAWLDREGIASTIVESAPNRGNLVARMVGSGEAPGLLLMGHVDVVPAENPDAWTHPPFCGEVHDGRVWGRGSSDMKGMVAAEAMAAIILKRAGVPLRGDLVLAAGADEESGGKWGFAWLAEHHPELLESRWAVNEGGGHPLGREPRLTYPVNLGEKGRLEVFITVQGRGYHASAPWMADSAIMRAQPILNRIAAWEAEVAPDPELFDRLLPALGVTERATPENIDRICAEVSAREPNLGSMLRAASRMTLVATMIRAGVKSNSVAETCVITCDVRTLPWQDEEYVARQLDRILDGIENVRYEIVTTAKPSASPWDPQFADALQSSIRAALGRDDVDLVPGLTTGFTDSRLVRPLGITAWGFGPSHPDSDPSLDGAHNIDESASIEDIMLMTRTFTALAWELLVEK